MLSVSHVSQALSWQVPPAGCPAALSDVLIAGKLHVNKFNYILRLLHVDQCSKILRLQDPTAQHLDWVYTSRARWVLKGHVVVVM
jgi:hypothetical protein